MSKPLISICIPVFNGEDYLKQCLDSVLTQTYPNIEVVIIDDHSTDNSAAFIRKYLNDNPSIKFYQNERNEGLVENWNKCIRLAKGEWIKFVFQDDFMDENCIEVFVENINSDERSCPLIVSERRFIIDSTLSRKEELYYSRYLPTLSRINIEMNGNYVSPESISNAAISHMSMNIIGEPTVVMFRRNMADISGAYNSRLEQICDLEFVMRIASVYGLIYIDHPLTFFRIHDKSTTSKNISDKYYRLSKLEPVKLAHLYLFGDEYNLLRSSLTSYHRFRLKAYFYVRGLEAWSSAKSNENNMRDFNAAAEIFPMMNDVKNSSFIYRFLFSIVLLKRFLNKIAGR